VIDVRGVRNLLLLLLLLLLLQAWHLHLAECQITARLHVVLLLM